jgi:RNA-binding protein Musashi
MTITRKIFVGGLPHNIKKTDLLAYFELFGEIEDSIIMHDRVSGKPRGFGFIIFRESSAVATVMANVEAHYINKKWIEVKRATPKEEMLEEL